MHNYSCISSDFENISNVKKTSNTHVVDNVSEVHHTLIHYSAPDRTASNYTFLKTNIQLPAVFQERFQRLVDTK